MSDKGINRIQVLANMRPLSPKAIIVAGGGPYDGNSLWDATQTTQTLPTRPLLTGDLPRMISFT